MTSFPFALRLFLRDWHSLELRLLALALIVAVAAITSVGFFTDRVDQALNLQAAEMLGADLVLRSANPIPDEFSQQATAEGLLVSRSMTFPSVILSGDKTRLVMVKAVEPGYPLRGTLEGRKRPDSPVMKITAPDRSQHLWSEAGLFSDLQITTTDRIHLGQLDYTINGILTRDNSDSGNLFKLGPTVLIPIADLPATGLITPASRVRHKLLIAGEPAAVKRFATWANNRLGPGIRIEGLETARPEIKTALTRAERFLGLAALVAVLVAGAAIALSTRQFVSRQSDATAILRCLGASCRLLLSTLKIRLLLLTLFATLVGSLIGYLAQLGLAQLVGEWFSTDLPPPTPYPILAGAATGIIMLLGFTLLPLSRLVDVPPLRVIRRELNAPPPRFWLLLVAASGSMMLLMLWQAGDAKLAGIVIAGTLLALLLFLLTAWVLIKLLNPLRSHSRTTWRYGLAGLARSPGLTTLQLTGFGIGILALLLLAIVRIDLLNAWNRSIPPGTPNTFLINIQPQEVEQLQKRMDALGLHTQRLYPMYRGRLTAINDRPVRAEEYPEGRPRHLVNREFNISQTIAQPDGNRILAGKWWERNSLDVPLFSVEKGVAETLGIHLDDKLTFNLAGIPVTARVSSLRSVKWDSFQPNFFVIGTPGLLQGHAATYITSLFIPDTQISRLSTLISEFPSVTPIDVSVIMQQIRDIIHRGSLAIEYIFIFTLLAGLLVLYAGIQAGREVRRQESAILRTLGMQRGRLLSTVTTEFFTLGLLAGILASLFATLIGWILSTQVFDLEYHFNGMIWISGAFGGALGIGVAGLLATYPLVIQPPLQILRKQ